VQIKKENADKHIQHLVELSPELAKLIIENAYGDVYSSINLDMKTVEIAIIAAPTAKGNSEPQLKVLHK
jgi:4-carboxymuconolactone decarboxylase